MTAQSYRKALAPHEKQGVVDALGENGVIIQVRAPWGAVGLQAVRKNFDGLICSLSHKIPEDLHGEYQIEFSYHKAKYESTAIIDLQDKEQYFLRLPKELYLVQRRNNFRALLPASWRKEIRIYKVEGEFEMIKGDLIDLSLKGCFFVTKNPGSMVSEDEVAGELSVSEFPTIKFTALVRRSNIRSDGKGFGLEFIEIEGKGTEHLNLITLKASRENRDYSKG